MTKLVMPEELRAFFREAASRRQRETRPCAVCGVAMENVIGKRRYCSTACHSRAARQRRAQSAPSSPDTPTPA